MGEVYKAHTRASRSKRFRRFESSEMPDRSTLIATSRGS
jgi:hypothetical protein